jgi:hypothetical protein
MNDGKVALLREGAPPWTFEGRWFLGTFDGHPQGPPSRRAVALTDFYALRGLRRSWLDLLEDSFELTRRGIEGAAAAVAKLEERLPPRAARQHDEEGPLLADPEVSLTVVERLAFLMEPLAVRGAGVQALADLAAVSDERVLRKGDVLFNPGWDREHLFLVVAGRAAAARSGGEERVYGRGELVAGAAALLDQVREWRAYAQTDARVLALPMEAWFDLMEGHFDLASSVFGALGTRRNALLEELASQAGPDGLILT